MTGNDLREKKMKKKERHREGHNSILRRCIGLVEKVLGKEKQEIPHIWFRAPKGVITAERLDGQIEPHRSYRLHRLHKFAFVVLAAFRIS